MKLLKKNSNIPSLTEWLEKINFNEIDEIKMEDQNKWKRLEILNNIIKLPFPNVEILKFSDIQNHTKLFRDLFKKRKNDKCTWRLIPKHNAVPKLRIRGAVFKKNLDWFHKQKINLDQYKYIEIITHANKTLYSAIFLVTDDSIWGEVIKGKLHELAFGVYNKTPILFPLDFKKKFAFCSNKKIRKIIKKATEKLIVTDPTKQKKLKELLNANFTTNGYLKGYFEIVVWPRKKIIFMDYSPILYKKLKKINIRLTDEKSDLQGICVSPGVAIGRVKIINDKEPKLNKGDILVCKTITLKLLESIKKSSAIISEQGNALSHFSIVSRELNKPYLVRVKNATKKLKNGNLITIDANKGIINIIK